MNKKEAAEYLGISPRMVENYVNKGELSVRKERGATGDIAVYDERELRALKAKIDARRAPRGMVIREGSESPEAEARTDSQPSQALARRADLTAFVEMLQKVSPAVAVPVADKLTLSLDEAARLSGLSRNHLRQAIEEKKLKARIIGRGWRVKRDDLDIYVRKL